MLKNETLQVSIETPFNNNQPHPKGCVTGLMVELLSQTLMICKVRTINQLNVTDVSNKNISSTYFHR